MRGSYDDGRGHHVRNKKIAESKIIQGWARDVKARDRDETDTRRL